MKVVILAGGMGSRISEESQLKPKPMVTIGEQPILWHILKLYSHFGFEKFVVCLGYRGDCIVDYFAKYSMYNGDVRFDFANRGSAAGAAVEILDDATEPWEVTLVKTGYATQTGGRLYRAKKYFDDSTFMMTYGDGVGDIDVAKLLEFHRSHGKLATVTAVRPLGRFGALELDGDSRVLRFQEKPAGEGGYINAGFFVLEPGVLDYIDGDIDSCVFEGVPLERLARDGQLVAYRHHGYWQPMDTLRDRRLLEEEWAKPNCAWRLWRS